ncbi:dolichol kinase [Halorubrum sp. JWXQ-INN 858]|uniref:dolichol kinase n=1 Tax=Halorubrum sp. JWXQ-INN 858 TaxID=2690782 RepID=UPI0013FB8B0E|nr:dolichol kinase [Halorubrum sp. JWXQ-INN 858]MWV63707.1 dolichol kinase [Halorubrum sp. JWXQ-INN 858]
MTLPAAEWRERVEFERRLVHAGGTLYPVPYLLGWISWELTGLLLLAGVGVVALLEFLRLGVGLDHAVYRALTREYEADGVAGYALYQVSMAGVALFFAPTIAIPAMWMLSIGDPVSGTLGRNAATEPKRPTVWIAMFAVCLALAVPFTVAAFGTVVGIAVAAAGAVAATVADGLPPVIRGVAVDDNLTIPPAAAVAMLALATLLG